MADRKSPFSAFQGAKDAGRLSGRSGRAVERATGKSKKKKASPDESKNPKSQEDRAKKMLQKITREAYEESRK